MDGVTVRRISGRQLQSTARGHSVTTDRKAEDGGTDTGCTSGELLLMAIGSCAAGSSRRYLEGLGIDCPGLALHLRFVPRPDGAHDAISIELTPPEGVGAELLPGLRDEILRGGVVGRLARGSDLIIELAEGGAP